jgi:hypothetical protein
LDDLLGRRADVLEHLHVVGPEVVVEGRHTTDLENEGGGNAATPRKRCGRSARVRRRHDVVIDRRIATKVLCSISSVPVFSLTSRLPPTSAASMKVNPAFSEIFTFPPTAVPISKPDVVPGSPPVIWRFPSSFDPN